MGLFGWRKWLRRQARAVGRTRGGRALRPRIEILEDRLAPATLTWTGAVNNLWDATRESSTAPTNWTSSDGRLTPLPQAGDDLVFPAGAANLANSNDLVGLSVHSITFQAPGYSLGGNALTVTGSLADQSTNPPAGQDARNSIGLDLTIPNTLVLAVTDAGETLSLPNALGGAGGLTKTGAGRAVLAQSNAYAGGTDVTAGALAVVQNASLGTGPVAVEAGAALEIQANLGQNAFLAIPNALTLNGGVAGTGAVRNLAGFNSLTGDVTLAGDTAVGVDVGELSFSGRVGGAGGLTDLGPGPLTLSGSAPNTYAGPTVVDAGFLSLAKNPGVVAVPGNLVIGSGAGGSGSGSLPTTVQLQGDGQIADTGRVTIASGLLDLNGFSDTIGSLAGTGQVNLSASGSEGPSPTVGGTLTIGTDNTSMTYAGVLGGTGGNLVKVGGGTLDLGGANTYTGTTSVNGGTLLVDGSQPGSAIVVNAGATLGGHGTVGPTTANAGSTVAPGDSPGVLRVRGGVTFNPGSVLLAELDGPAAGTGYDQLSVVGPVVLNGPTLHLAPGFSPAPGQDFVLIATNGSGPVRGTFAGAPEDALLRHGGAFFDLSYAGGTDVDVQALTRADLFVRALFADFGAPSTRATRAPFERLADGGASRLSVARAFLTSPARRLAEVVQFYTTFGQPPDARQGLYVRQLLRGEPAGQVLLNFLTSRPFRARHRGNVAFLRDVFAALLGHPAGRHAQLGRHSLGYYVRQLSSGVVGRSELARGLLASEDVYRAAVLQEFAALLGTVPTPAQLQSFTAQLVSGALTPDALSESLVVPDAYVDSFLARCASGKVAGVICVNV